uniref:Coiled-coil domain containing 91 n=1 Tax=Canis lupus familiaris TaxID=9615 RepID=A0A8P0TEI6_CANLF
MSFFREKCNFHCELPSRIYGRPSLTLLLMPMWNKVSGVHLSPASPEIVLDHDHSPSVGCLSSEPIISSPENTHADNSIVSQTVPKAQIQQSTHTHLDISLFPLGLNDEKSNGTIALVDDSEDPGANVSNIQLQQKISSLEIKLKVSEEEKQRIKKDVESLMEKHSVLEKDFLKEKEQEAISFQDRYKELQEKHKQELEDMRKAGHEALSIIVDEYKALLQSSVKQQVEAIEKQYISAIEKQAHKCEELLNTQHQRLLEMLDTEKELLKEKIKEALIQQSQEQKDILEKCLEEERQRNKEALVSAAKVFLSVIMGFFVSKWNLKTEFISGIVNQLFVYKASLQKNQRVVFFLVFPVKLRMLLSIFIIVQLTLCRTRMTLKYHIFRLLLLKENICWDASKHLVFFF